MSAAIKTRDLEVIEAQRARLKSMSIKEQYDEMVKYAVGITTRTADAEAILRQFTNDNLNHPTYKAFVELGRVLKTIFLCRYRDQTGPSA